MLLERVYYRLRPSEGWLTLGLLVTAVVVLVTAVREVRWTPEDEVLIPAAAIGLLLGVVLAKRPIRASWAWLLIADYALLVTFVSLAQLLPPLGTLRQGWEPTRQFWRQQGALFFDRIGGWLLAVFSGGTSRETVVFAIAIGLAAFLLAAFVGWVTLRGQRPLPALMLMGLVMALNGYFGVAEIWWLALFVGVAVLLTAVVNFAHLEQEWEQTKVDYPEDIRLESLGYSTIIALFLVALALMLPAFSITRLQAWVASLRPVAAVESSFGQAFAGVEVPRERMSTPNPGGVGGSGILPRQYLLGMPPELAETVVMTAVVTIPSLDHFILAPPELLQGHNWRAFSYDVYTGQGWAISEERLAPTAPFEAIPVPTGAEQTQLEQTVYWVEDERAVRYSVGLPFLFDHATIVSWRGVNDLARVRAEEFARRGHYLANSRIVSAMPEQLRQTRLADTPPALLSRYTALPDDIPLRIVQLAQDVAAEYENPYDQARALEQFLRQYPYSLETPLPPPGFDPVEYFLFDLQRGYCDYYASSMVVMARTLGLPARLVVGFAGQAPDEKGTQVIQQINGHSWVEVYFAGYGWVEFEPTATFASPRDTAVTINPGSYDLQYGPPDASTYTPPPIPPAAPVRPFPWSRLIIVGLLAVGLWWVWRRQRREQAARADGVVWSYGRLQANARKIGLSPLPSQTPDEFSQLLLTRLDQFGQNKRLAATIAAMVAPIMYITLLYNKRRYGGMPAGGQDEALRAWKLLQRPFRRLRLSRFPQSKES
jgi:hypothetical protein